ncbi:heterogeneous nuclear ribonucleoprotein L-like, partial [Centroberyx affinis]|uniref:heterogeneous nuclear ribonucleoprotein L-like n=1 Tax=Centroberyx affinis TaxID=166261 RepID=UPI003A5BCF0D
RGKGRQRQAILGEHPSNGYGAPGAHCPLLPLPGSSRVRRSGEEVQELVSYPLLLPHSPAPSCYLGPASSSVAMVSGLHPAKMNCSRIFSLFCLYGNVEKVKFMKSVPGTALVEMGDEFSVDRAVTHLHSIKLFSKRLSVCVSKQQAVIPSQVFELLDGSSSYQDFSLSRNNRFSSQQSSRNIIQPPAAVLHFYNAPPTLSHQQLHRLCTENELPGFIKFKVFDAKPSSKTMSGLLEFDSKTEAVEVLTVLNHHQIRIPNGANPYTLKLCFSTSSHL